MRPFCRLAECGCSVDDEGRVVLPAAIREQAGLIPGTEVEVRYEDGEVRLVRTGPGPRLVRVRGRLRARPTAAADERVPVDVAKLVEEERDRRPW